MDTICGAVLQAALSQRIISPFKWVGVSISNPRSHHCAFRHGLSIPICTIIQKLHRGTRSSCPHKHQGERQCSLHLQNGSISRLDGLQSVLALHLTSYEPSLGPLEWSIREGAKGKCGWSTVAILHSSLLIELRTLFGNDLPLARQKYWKISPWCRTQKLTLQLKDFYIRTTKSLGK